MIFLLSAILTKIINTVISILGIGAGKTWPGHVVLYLYPGIIKDIKKKLPEKIVFISGTNGKTTTAKLIRHIFEHEGLKVLHNDTGANLLNGVVSSTLLKANLKGELKYDAAVFELDEFTLPTLLEDITPQVLVLLNLSRDQLDRHWEIDVVMDKWLQAVNKLPQDVKLVLDKTQPRLAPLVKNFKGEVKFFDDDRSHLIKTKLHGIFNAKNINCALSVAEILGVDIKKAGESLKDFQYAYGRGEVVNYKRKEWKLLLAKNPESLNQNLDLLLEGSLKYDTLLLVLNDNIPDGLDVSWIYDVRPQLLKNVGEGKLIFVSGKRALDMAVRLQYSGLDIEEERVIPQLSKAVEAIAKQENTKKIVVLPNYSAMLEIRKILVGRKIL